MPDPAGPRYAWPGTALEARFRARAIAVHLRAPRPPPYVSQGKTYADETTPYTVFLDDRAPFGIAVGPSVERYELATDLDPERDHVVTVVRDAEASAGVHQALGFDAGGRALAPGAAPAKRRRRRVEAVGDSITCGYGVLGADAHCSFTYATERASLAWAGVVERDLDVDVSVVAWSGRGVLRNYDGARAGTMPELFAYALPAAHAPFDFASAPAPDAVVTLLGTNDFLGGAGVPLDVPAFEAAYERFLVHVRAVYPRAALVVATSPMLGGDKRAAANPAFERVARAAGADLVDLAWQGDRVGCDSHPNAAVQRDMAAALEPILRKRLGL